MFCGGQNRHYRTAEEFLEAIASAVRVEYRAIVDAGFVLQLDDPGLPDTWDMLDPHPTVEEYKRYATLRVDALNHALESIPEDRVRYHICWGSWHGPHSLARHCGCDAPGQGAGLFRRGGKRSTRTRVQALEGGQAPRRKDPHSRCRQPCDKRPSSTQSSLPIVSSPTRMRSAVRT